MTKSNYSQIFELTRGETVESVHHGAIAVLSINDDLLAWYGNPEAVTFLRSTAKPFQALPFLEHGGESYFHLSQREIALMCASHSGTDEHVAVAQSLQKKVDVSESDLMCGVHPPFHKPTARAMRLRGEDPTPSRHNCSGKHTGMLANVRLRGSETQFASELPYIDPEHPIQKEILNTFAEMCNLQENEVELGIDGCSAPNFAVPLRNAALAFARLCDPVSGGVSPPDRVTACRLITSSMSSNPEMVGGPDRFDTRLMEVGAGRFVVKGGAEGYQGVGLMPGALGPGSPAMGITLKIADGGARDIVHSAVTLEVLRQLGALSEAELDQLSEFGPSLPIFNWRKILVGQARTTFVLERAS